MLKIFIALSVFFLSFQGVSAHGAATTEKFIQGEYLLQFEYDTQGNPVAGEVNALSFELFDAENEGRVEFNRVFVTISKKDGPIVFLSNIYALDVLGIMAGRVRVVLPDEGQYEIEAQYYNNEDKLAEHTFELEVDPASPLKAEGGFKRYLWAITLIAGLAAGLLIGMREDEVKS